MVPVGSTQDDVRVEVRATKPLKHGKITTIDISNAFIGNFQHVNYSVKLFASVVRIEVVEDRSDSIGVRRGGIIESRTVNKRDVKGFTIVADLLHIRLYFPCYCMIVRPKCLREDDVDPSRYEDQV